MTNEESLHQLISQINRYYQNFLGYSVKETELIIKSQKEWTSFCNQHNLNENSSGIYMPRNQTAIISSDSPLSLFHEYFGHGLFCEESLEGRKLVKLEKTLLEEEKQEFQGKQFTLKELEKFRKGNKTFQSLQELNEKNLVLYEGFALWTEYFLSKGFDFSSLFEKRYASLNKDTRKYIDGLIFFNQDYGDLATFYNFGMARRTTPKRVKKLLEEIYREKIKEAKLAILYGSKKEFADIDIFLVSNELEEINSPWLDIRVEHEGNFEDNIKNFDVSVTDPVLTGEFLIGKEDYFNEKRKQLLEQPITKKAIKHNLMRTEEQKRLALNYPENSEANIHGLTYSQSYFANALALMEGRRLLTKERLLSSQNKRINIEGSLE
jgi:hypothetical protein